MKTIVRRSNNLFFFRALVQVVKSDANVFRESRSKDIFVGSKLMPRLPHDRVDHVEARNFVLLSALLDELFDTLNDVFVVLNSSDGSLCNGSHLGLRDWRLNLVQRRELEEK